MRLGQLARKLSMRPQEIVDFLANQQISIEAGSNSRIEDELVVKVMTEFAPHLLAEVKEELAHEVSESEEEISQPQNSTVEVIVEEAIEVAVEVAEVEENVDSLNPEPIEIELIKAPKIELPGLKVVGKIDLPEPKKKEPQDEVEGESGVGIETQGPPKRGFRNERAERYAKPKKNPVTIQREREAREAERRRREEAKLEKDRKKMVYENKVKAKLPEKSSKPKKPSKIQERNIASLSTQQKPTTLWGKFTSWLFRK